MTKLAKLTRTTAIAALAFAAPLAAHAQDAKEVVTIVKITGENWFTRMEEGVDAFSADNDGVNARQVGPAQADAAQQTAIVQDLVAQGVDVKSLRMAGWVASPDMSLEAGIQVVHKAWRIRRTNEKN